jgi:NAD(P)-dependent dehydrogenase (short-subunit alcohol dehydrogenase family)
MANYADTKFESPTQSYASIINMSGIAGRYGGSNLTHYGISKAGIEGFTKCLAKEYGSNRIRCNVIVPYMIETPMLDQPPYTNREFRKALEEKAALKRFGKPEEVAQLIYFLASDSSSYITGADIDISGGY